MSCPLRPRKRAYRRSTRSPDRLWNLDPRPYGLKRREVCGTKFFYLLGQILGFLAFLPINLIELITEIEDLAIGLGLSLITTYDADDLLCQFGSIGRLTLRIQRYGADGQNRNCQQPIYNALVALPS